MFREMRRRKQELSPEESCRILECATSGVLATAGDADYPYAVPLSYVYDRQEQKIYFHCAKTGHKLDAVQRNSKVSFCVIEQDQVVPKEYTTYFRSVIVFGRIRILKEASGIWKAAEKLAFKYTPEISAVETGEEIRKEIRKGINEEIEGAFGRLCILEMQIEHISGKEAKELVNKK